MSFPPPAAGTHSVAVLDRRELAEQRLVDAIGERARREADEARAARRRRITGWITRPVLLAALLASTAWLFTSLRDTMRDAMASPKITSPFDAILADTVSTSAQPVPASAPAVVPMATVAPAPAPAQGGVPAPVPVATTAPVVVMVPATASPFVLRAPTFAITLPAPPADSRSDQDAYGSTSTLWQTSTPTAAVAVVATDYGDALLDDATKQSLANERLDDSSNTDGTITSDQATAVAGVPARSVVVTMSSGITIHATTVWHGSTLIMVCGTQRDGSAGEPAEYRTALNSLQLL